MSKTNKQPYVVLVGMDDVRGVYASRTFGRKGVPIIGIINKKGSAGSWSRYPERKLQANTDTEDVIVKLEELGPTLDQKAVIVPCFDSVVYLISEHRERLKPWFHIVMPPDETVRLLMNKNEFYPYAMEANLPVPKTFFLNTLADAEQAAKELSYPCVVKPPSSKLKRWLDKTHLKAFKIHSEHELIEAFHTYSESAGTLIVQQWVEGGDNSLFACHCYFSINSEPLVTFTSRKLRQWPPLVGEVCLAEAIINDRVREITVELFSGVNYRGVGYVEVKRDIDTGEYYIIEPNLRLSGRAGIAEANGVELLYTMYCDVTGMPLPENRTQNYVGRKWIYLRRDVQSTLHYIRGGNLSFKEWRRSVRGPKVDAMFSRDDPGPFFGDLARLVRLGVKSQERRKRDYREIVTEIKSQ